MKKYGLIGVILLLVVAFAMLFPSNGIAAPNLRPKDEINVFNGRWFATRLFVDGEFEKEISERLKIECNKNTEICRVEIISDWSNSCSTPDEDIGVLLKGKGPVEVDWRMITIDIDAYCATKPPTFSFSTSTLFIYNENDNTLLSPLPLDEWITWHRGK